MNRSLKCISLIFSLVVFRSSTVSGEETSGSSEGRGMDQGGAVVITPLQATTRVRSILGTAGLADCRIGSHRFPDGRVRTLLKLPAWRRSMEVHTSLEVAMVENATPEDYDCRQVEVITDDVRVVRVVFYPPRKVVT